MTFFSPLSNHAGMAVAGISVRLMARRSQCDSAHTSEWTMA